MPDFNTIPGAPITPPPEPRPRQVGSATPAKEGGGNMKWAIVIGIAAILSFGAVQLLVPGMLSNYVLKTDNTNNIYGAVATAKQYTDDQTKTFKEDVNKMLTTQNTNIGSAKSTADGLSSQINQAVQAANTAAAKVNDISSKVDSAITAANNAKSSVDTTNNNLTNLQKQVTDLTAQLAAAKVDIQTLKSQPAQSYTNTSTSTAQGVSSLNNVSAWVSSFGSAFGMGQSVPSFAVSTNGTGAGTGTFTLYVANSTNRTIQNLQLSMALFFADATGVKQQDLLAGNTVAMGGVGSPIWVSQNPSATNMVVFTSGISNSLFTWNFSQVPGTATYYTTLTVTGASANTTYTVYPQVKVVSFQ